jgi:solute carrier family 35 protein E3
MHPSMEVALIVVANVVSVVGVVSMNKTVYNSGFNFPTTLMCLHFLCTWGFVVFAERMRWFTEKKIPTRQYATLGAAQTASVGFVNLSLLYNPVGTYQLFKFTNVFVTCVVEYFWKHKTYSVGIYLSLTTLVLGVTIATVTQVTFSPIGLLFGLLGSVSTAFYQILNKQVQTDFEVTPMQLLQYEQPFTALFAALFACFSDDLVKLTTVELSQPLLVGIAASCVFAFGVNLTCYLIIGKTSPLTYSVVGHTKTVGVLLIGFFQFGETTTWKNLLGLAMAFAGIVVYTHLSSQPAVKKVDTVATPEPAPLIVTSAHNRRVSHAVKEETDPMSGTPLATSKEGFPHSGHARAE